VISQIVNKSTIAGGYGSKLSGILAIYLIPYTVYHKTYRADDLAQTQCLAGSIALLIDLLKRGSEAGKL